MFGFMKTGGGIGVCWMGDWPIKFEKDEFTRVKKVAEKFGLTLML
jgi:hypothetical protein